MKWDWTLFIQHTDTLFPPSLSLSLNPRSAPLHLLLLAALPPYKASLPLRLIKMCCLSPSCNGLLYISSFTLSSLVSSFGLMYWTVQLSLNLRPVPILRDLKSVLRWGHAQNDKTDAISIFSEICATEEKEHPVKNKVANTLNRAISAVQRRLSEQNSRRNSS